MYLKKKISEVSSLAVSPANVDLVNSNSPVPSTHEASAQLVYSQKLQPQSTGHRLRKKAWATLPTLPTRWKAKRNRSKWNQIPSENPESSMWLYLFGIPDLLTIIMSSLLTLRGNRNNIRRPWTPVSTPDSRGSWFVSTCCVLELGCWENVDDWTCTIHEVGLPMEWGGLIKVSYEWKKSKMVIDHWYSLWLNSWCASENGEIESA
jgi:hypothetical protein